MRSYSSPVKPNKTPIRHIHVKFKYHVNTDKNEQILYCNVEAARVANGEFAVACIFLPRHMICHVFLQVALRAANVADASVLLAGSAPAALGSSLHDELRVVGKTLFHCDLAQQIILARLNLLCRLRLCLSLSDSEIQLCVILRL
jgi:hypothetical protein